MGHGTTVSGEFDIDLVIYSRGKVYAARLNMMSVWQLYQ